MDPGGGGDKGIAGEKVDCLRSVGGCSRQGGDAVRCRSCLRGGQFAMVRGMQGEIRILIVNKSVLLAL